jgi:thiamine biosynthesis lipoprotein
MTTGDRSESGLIPRRGFLVLGLGAFVVTGLGVAARRPPPVVRRSVPAMGTVAELAVAHDDPARAQAAIDAAIEELHAIERHMTRFAPTSDVGRANRLAAAGPVAIGDDTAAVLRTALGWAEASDGAFDPCLGRAIRVWDVGRRTAPPPPGDVRAFAGRRLYRGLDLDRWRGRAVVRYASPEVELDLGGIAKGHGVDRAVAALRRQGIARGLVNVGGDLYALGDAGDGPWRVGIRSPREPGRLAGTVEVRDAAVATSGDYLQYFDHGGRRYHHLLDPETGAPRRTDVHSLTVRADTCLTADAAATTLYGMAPAGASRVLQALGPDAQVVSVIAGRG